MDAVAFVLSPPTCRRVADFRSRIDGWTLRWGRFCFCLVYCYWTASGGGGASTSTTTTTVELYTSIGLMNYLFTYITSIPYSTNIFVYLTRIPTFRYAFMCGFCGPSRSGSDLSTWTATGSGKNGSKHRYTEPEIDLDWRRWYSELKGHELAVRQWTPMIFIF